MQPEELARRLAELADSKGATGLVVLDMRELVSYTDFLVIGTARNERQARAILDEVQVRLKHDQALLPGRVEGQTEASWVLLDYLDCILHVFTTQARDYYRLDSLWGEAERLDLGELGVERAAEAAAGGE